MKKPKATLQSQPVRFRAKPGFDWAKLTWGRPDSVPSALCSYCSGVIPDDSVPLIMWKADGSAVRFCEKCIKRWFGR